MSVKWAPQHEQVCTVQSSQSERAPGVSEGFIQTADLKSIRDNKMDGSSLSHMHTHTHTHTHHHLLPA